ncbi:MAG: hypothetical protein AAGJ57_08165 [Pseudomonadota bacterium]
MPTSLNTNEHPSLPLIIAGPILRKVTATEVNIWLVTTQPLEGLVEISDAGTGEQYYSQPVSKEHLLQVGKRAWVCMLMLQGEFPTHRALRYQLHTQSGLLTELMPHLTYGEDKQSAQDVGYDKNRAIHNRLSR